jgi:hypothetical protein
MSAPLLAAVLTVAAALALPDRLPLHRAAPATAATVLVLALLLRALVTVTAGFAALVRLSDVGIVEAALGWCWHELLPDLPHALGFAEHPVAHAAVAAPLALLAGSVAWLLVRQLRAWLALRRWLAGAVGRGPRGSTIVPDDRLLLAVTKVGRGRVLVSERALEELDDGELAAGLTHELGHIRRRHRLVLRAVSLLAALARPLPGTRATERAVCFQLERDADAYAVRELRDPLSLASAICKAAGTTRGDAALLTLTGSGPTTVRVRELLEGAAARSRRAERLAKAGAALLAAVIVAVGAGAPGWTAPAAGSSPTARDAHPCSHHS